MPKNISLPWNRLFYNAFNTPRHSVCIFTSKKLNAPLTNSRYSATIVISIVWHLIFSLKIQDSYERTTYTFSSLCPKFSPIRILEGHRIGDQKKCKTSGQINVHNGLVILKRRPWVHYVFCHIDGVHIYIYTDCRFGVSQFICIQNHYSCFITYINKPD